MAERGTSSPANGDRVRIAVVGSGPAGIYTAEALIKQAPIPAERVSVDILERLPTPYGLVRYGVAPDHPSIKSIANYLQRVLEHPSVRFVGRIELGEMITIEDLSDCYDAVVFATGAMRDRRLSIEGEDLPGSVAATDFVNWYCGHPDVVADRYTLDAERVAVIGVGNVAVDVVRILARGATELRPTDVPEPVMAALENSAVTHISMIGRRGPAHAKFTTKELRELGRLPDAAVMVDAGELDPDGTLATDYPNLPRQIRGNLDVLTEWANRPPTDARRRVDVRFWLRPVEIVGDGRVEGLRLERTRLDDDGRVVGTGAYETLDVDLVLRSVGYQSVPLPGVPFDERSMTVPNDAGRVLVAGRPLSGSYVAGWLKRGPTGVIGTNKSDAAETVRSLYADLDGAISGGGRAIRDLDEVLAERGAEVTGYTEWLAIDTAEAELARRLDRGERVKLSGLETMLAVCRVASGPSG